jgi:hypothetical protein
MSGISQSFTLTLPLLSGAVCWLYSQHTVFSRHCEERLEVNESLIKSLLRLKETSDAAISLQWLGHEVRERRLLRGCSQSWLSWCSIDSSLRLAMTRKDVNGARCAVYTKSSYLTHIYSVCERRLGTPAWVNADAN